MNRRFPALALAGVMTLSMLSACGSPAAPSEPTPTPPTVESPVVTPTPLPEPTATLEPTGTPAPENTPAGDINVPGQNPPESSAPTAKPTKTPTPTKTPAPTKAPTATPTPEPAPTPVDQGDAVQAVWDRIASEIELPSFGDMDSEILSALYGIDSANLVSYIGKIPLMNVQATEVFIAQVKEGSMDAVKSGIEKRQADLVEQWSIYLHEQLELVQNYKLVTNGNYVLFAISYEAAQMETIFNDCTN